MLFEEAYVQMREGQSVSHPEFKGWFFWDAEEQSVRYGKEGLAPVKVGTMLQFDTFLQCTFDDQWSLHTLPKAIAQDEAVEQPLWWEKLHFEPKAPKVLKLGSRGKSVTELQRTLVQQGASIAVDGIYGAGTQTAVRNVQRQYGLVADGVFGAKTGAVLLGSPLPEALTQQNMQEAADALGCEVEVIMAVSEVESRGRGFFSNGKPAILFERHWMRRRLSHHGIDYRPYVKREPNLVNRRSGGYKGGLGEWSRLSRARRIHEISALESASWGAYQIMGFHWEALGYDSVKNFVLRMEKNELEHLKAFVTFIEIDPTLLKALREKDFLSFALRYNGPHQKGYDRKMADAYARLKGVEE